ncbi:MAG: hypothetical protein WC483_06425, partial [Candidatus Paceibacterota bacterium]
YWDFDTTSGTTTVYDISGNNNNGTFRNGATLTTLSTNKKVLSTDGTDDYVDTSHSDSLETITSNSRLS